MVKNRYLNFSKYKTIDVKAVSERVPSSEKVTHNVSRMTNRGTSNVNIKPLEPFTLPKGTKRTLLAAASLPVVAGLGAYALHKAGEKPMRKGIRRLKHGKKVVRRGER